MAGRATRVGARLGGGAKCVSGLKWMVEGTGTPPRLRAGECAAAAGEVQRRPEFNLAAASTGASGRAIGSFCGLPRTR